MAVAVFDLELDATLLVDRQVAEIVALREADREALVPLDRHIKNCITDICCHRWAARSRQNSEEFLMGIDRSILFKATHKY